MSEDLDANGAAFKFRPAVGERVTICVVAFALIE
jgi:hypothetical protein